MHAGLVEAIALSVFFASAGVLRLGSVFERRLDRVGLSLWEFAGVEEQRDSGSARDEPGEWE